MTICYWESLDQPMASIYIDSSSIYSWVRRACFRPRLLPGGFPEIWCIFRLIGTRENPFIIYIQTFDHCCHGSPCAKLVWSSFEWQGYVPRGERHGTTRMPNSWNPGWKKWSAVLAPVHASTIMSPYSRRYWICDLILTVWFSETRKEHRSIRSILSYIRWIFSKLFQTFITIDPDVSQALMAIRHLGSWEAWQSPCISNACAKEFVQSPDPVSSKETTCRPVLILSPHGILCQLPIVSDHFWMQRESKEFSWLGMWITCCMESSLSLRTLHDKPMRHHIFRSIFGGQAHDIYIVV
jgi:hypothetical protein